MVARRTDKRWSFLKAIFLALLLALAIFIVLQKENIMEEFCNCTPCYLRDPGKRNSHWEDFVDIFCVCPTCD